MEHCFKFYLVASTLYQAEGASKIFSDWREGTNIKKQKNKRANFLKKKINRGATNQTEIIRVFCPQTAISEMQNWTEVISKPLNRIFYILAFTTKYKRRYIHTALSQQYVHQYMWSLVNIYPKMCHQIQHTANLLKTTCRFFGLPYWTFS